MSLSKKLTCEGTLRQVFYLSEAPFPSYDPILHPPLHTIRIYNILIHRGKEGEGEELTRDKVTGAIVHKAGRKYQHDCLYLQSINSV
jgi:hypothetical protein